MGSRKRLLCPQRQELGLRADRRRQGRMPVQTGSLPGDTLSAVPTWKPCLGEVTLFVRIPEGNSTESIGDGNV